MERIIERSEVEMWRTYEHQHLKSSVIIHLQEGDKVIAKDITNQQGPEDEVLTVVDDHLEEVEVETEEGERFILTGIHYKNLGEYGSGGDGPFTWLRTEERKSAGRVIDLQVLSLKESEN